MVCPVGVLIGSLPRQTSGPRQWEEEEEEKEKEEDQPVGVNALERCANMAG